MAALTNTQRKFWISLALVLGTLIVYWPVHRHGFTEYDDQEYVTQNPHVSCGLTLGGVKWAFTSAYASNWHPVTWLSHMLDVQLFGENAGPHHTVSLLFHAANALLLLLLLHRLTDALWPSAFVAALFAWHPLHVESVAWIAERKDVLSAFFGLLTLWSYAGYTQTHRRRHLGLALLWFSLGLMAKPMLVTLPFVLLLLDFWPLGRLNPNSDQSGNKSAPGRSGFNLSPLFLEKIPFFALSMASGIVTFLVQRAGGSVASGEALPFDQRVANALVSYTRYIGKTFWPADLAIIYPLRSPWPGWQVGLAVVMLLVITILVVRSARRLPYLAAGWFWFVGMLVPVIGLVQVGRQAMADRYTYLPLVGIFIMVAWGLAELSRPAWQPLLALVGTAALAVSLLLTAGQVRVWSSSEALFAHAITAAPNNAVAHKALGRVFDKQEKWDEARVHYLEAVRLDPTLAEAQYNLGVLSAKQGNLPEAVDYYTAALRGQPNLNSASNGQRSGISELWRNTHYNLANALLLLGRADQAIPHYETALQLDSNGAAAQNNLAIALTALGRNDQALPHFDQAIRLKPDWADPHFSAAVACEALGRFPDAAAHFARALELNPALTVAHRGYGWLLARQGNLTEAAVHLNLFVGQNPNDAEAHVFLGVTLAAQQKMEEAMKHLQEALRLRPDLPVTLNALARLQATHENAQWRNASTSVSYAEQACQLTSRSDPRYLDTLAAAYAEAGRFGEAVATARLAANLATVGKTTLAAAINDRIKIYRSNQPYREPVDPGHY